MDAGDSQLTLRVETSVPASSSILEDLHLHRLTGRVPPLNILCRLCISIVLVAKSLTVKYRLGRLTDIVGMPALRMLLARILQGHMH